MRPIPFEGHNRTFAANQPPYHPLPAHVDGPGIVTCCWRLSWRERLQVLLTGRVWQRIMTFSKPLQPQQLRAEKPNLEPNP